MFPRVVFSTLALTLMACSSETPKAKDRHVEIFSFWTAPGEAEALDSLMNVYTTKYPGTTWTNSAVTGSDNASEQLEQRMINGLPPDTFQTAGRTEIERWVMVNGVDDSESKMEPMDSIATANGWYDAIPPEVLDVVTFNGHVYAIPLNIERINSFFYNIKVLNDHGLQPPTTLEEFYTVADALKADGITPLAVGCSEPWTMGLLFWENLLVAKAGRDYFVDFLHGRGNPDDPQIRDTLVELDKMLDYVNDDAANLTWDEAVELVHSGDAAMTIMGDWTKGYLVQ
ncbi:MAG TPA: ABC transporter substrate-binding protein, partial [Polyangiaceae bacterium]|nr:ABC transporter substrate-binding protein [Polyangiaceae bacterium]